MKAKFMKIFLCLLMILIPMLNVQITVSASSDKSSDLIINDADVGEDFHLFQFNGNWGTSDGYPDRFYEGDEHWFNFARYQEGDSLPNYQIKFKGTGIELYGEKQPGLGIYHVYLDGVRIDEIDGYHTSNLKTKLYSKEGLPYGEHIIKVELSGTKNIQSKGRDGEIDYAKVLDPGQTVYENIFNRNDLDNWDKALTYNGKKLTNEQRYANMFTTHKIAVATGDVISWGLFGKDEYVLEVYDKNDQFLHRVLSADIEVQEQGSTVIGVDNKSYKEAIASYEVKDDMASYVRILGNISTKDQFMVFKNLQNGLLDWPNKYIAYEYEGNKNNLYGKSVLFAGDSITNAVKDPAHPYYGWAGRIGTKNDMNWKNAGISSATISTALSTSYPTNRVVNQLKQDQSYDYVILHGGMNDSIAETSIGEISDSYDLADFDIHTFSGGMEELLCTAKARYPDAIIGYIVNYATPNSTWGGSSHDNKAYFDQAKKICEKWEVPYLDLFGGGVTEDGVFKSYSYDILQVTSGVNMYNGLASEIHIGSKGYDLISPYIESWMEDISVTNQDIMTATIGSAEMLQTQEDYETLITKQDLSWNDIAWKGDQLLSKVVLCSRDKDVNNAEVIASDFVNGDATISSSNVDIKWLKDVKANIGRGSGGAPVKDFPEVIDKGGKIDIEPNKAKFSWLTINVPEDAEPGTYTGTITVNADELKEPYVFEYTFVVLDIVQPTTEEMDTQIQVWQHPFSVAEYYGVKKEDYFTEEHFKYMRDSMKEYHSMGGRDVVANIVEEAWNHQSYYGDPSMVKWTKKADGTMEFNYDWYDAWINFQIETGVLNPEEGIGQIKCYSIVPWANQIAYYDEATGTTKKQQYKPGNDDWKNMWTPFLQDFMKHSKEKGWFDITYISMDERGINELIPAVDLIKSIVDENGVPFKISSAFNYDSSEGYDFSDKIDDISIGMSEISHTTEKMRDMSEHRRELGLTTTVYTCTGMYPNNFTISDPADNEYVMWYTLTQNSDGFMRWAWDNYVPDMHGNITYKYWEPGDGWFMYPGVKGVDEPGKIYSTPRYEMMKKGLRDINKAKYLMAQSDELNTEITELVRSIERPQKGGNGYGSATYANQAERNKVFTETARMRNGIMNYTREFINSTPVVGDKTLLQELYTLCVDTVNNGYTTESWTAFKTALNEAKAILDKEDTSQTEIDAAKTALETAYDNLVEDTTLAKDILKGVIDKADGFVANNKLDNLAPNVKAMILNNLAEAKAVYDDSNATNNECLRAWLNLANALQYMDFIADKADLKSLIDECDALDLAGYTGGVEEFKAALAEAKVVYADDGVLQDTINDAYDKLSNAKDALVKDIVNKDLLASIIHDITNTIGDGSKYKKDTAWETFQTALTNANNVLGNENATAEDVNKALTDLTSSYLDIRLLPDEALLQQLVDFLAIIDRTDLTQYNAVDVSKILNAKAKVMEMTADPANITVGDVESIQDEMASIIDIIQNNKVEPETPEVPEEPTVPGEPTTPSPEEVAKPEDTAPTAKPAVNGTVKPGTTTTGDTSQSGMFAAMLILGGIGMYMLRKENDNL